MVLAIALLMLVRALFGGLLGGEAFKRRMLVLGAGAARSADHGARPERPGAGFLVAGFVGMNDGPQRIAEAIHRAAIDNLARSCRRRSAPAKWCSRSTSGATRCR